MTTALAALQELTSELERLFPPGGRELQALACPLGELRRLVETSGDAPVDVGAQLDLIEDLLESLLRTRGWPAVRR